MHDGKSLQAGTSHYFGDGFAKAFDIQFTGRDNKLQHPHQTSWGVTTRLIGAIIMTHGDNNGLVLPPQVAPIQVVIIPVAQHKEGVLEKAGELKQRLEKICRVKMDDSNNSPGWKYAEYEMKGVPLRLEIGPRDIEQNQCVLVRRDNREKTIVSLDELETVIPQLLEKLHDSLYQKALETGKNAPLSPITWRKWSRLPAAKTVLSKPCGAAIPPARKLSKRKPALPPAACPLSRNIWTTSVPAAANPQKPWSTGAKRINKIIFKKLSASKGKTGFFAAKPPAKPGLFADSLLQ